ncbi:MAG: lipid-A-disaccharide synthase [Marinilabiliales bacterium]|nr:MAG: lipid-A-disaccharide synthase [Marinilabiliales bacterium]
MRYYIIAGEASGDLHGSKLMKAIRDFDPDADFRFWGGDLMKAAGGTLVRHINTTSFMGFWEVLKNIGKIFRALRLCRKDLIRFSPDALILIDYPGFNLRMARYAKKHGIRVIYYISPKVWAWNSSRVKIIKKYVDHMLTILPFETEFFRRYGFQVDYVGNPVADAIENRSCRSESAEMFRTRTGVGDKPLIAVLPGSRIQEINGCLPVMLSVAGRFSGYRFVIAGAPSVPPDIYQRITGGKFTVLFNETYALLQHSSAAIVVSGTATLETGLLGIPFVVCYRGSFVSYQIARMFIRVRYISLVNLILEKEVVRELLQDRLSSRNLAEEMDRILSDHVYRENMLSEMNRLRLLVGSAGASERAAGKIAGYLGIGK